MRFPLADCAWPPGPRVAAAHDSGIDGRAWAQERPYASHIWPSARQNSPSRPARRDQPVQNSPSTPPPAGIPRKSSPSTRVLGLTREKVHPAQPLHQYFREKVRPAGHKTPFLGHLSCAGRTFSRSRPLRSEQGELYPACGPTSGTKLSPLVASAGDSGRKLSRHTPPTGPTGTKLSHHAPKRCFRPILRQQGELCTASATNNPSRAKKVTHQHPTNTPPPPPTRPSPYFACNSIA